ncbi:MAG: hypothetical protein COX51_05810 [Syntrophobacteraceae bacterium CG23_combo_of_CG06-09_8_20_14_all_50_8]|nr:MAG: hypothetical protein COX51_05810 [Syntrophobacteraceae bacterium CG23_combo_of_CG06-09_8_20_14_all_50_8]
MPWYVIYTRSRHEDKVYSGLIKKAYNTFLPKIEVWSRRKDRKRKLLRPLFPGYLFVDMPRLDNQSKLDVLKTSGVVRMLGNQASSEPAAVPDEKIEAIRKIIHSKVEVQQLQYPKEGEPARIMDGFVTGIDYKKEIFFVAIELLQRSIGIKLEGFQIERI